MKLLWMDADLQNRESLTLPKIKHIRYMYAYVIDDIVETHCYVVKSNCSKEVNCQTGKSVEENYKNTYTVNHI